MLTAVVTNSAGLVQVSFLEGALSAADEQAHEDVPTSDINPIFPELKEVVWGFGSFVVLAVVLRYVLFPKVKQAMQTRYEGIQADKASAEALTAAARADVASYEAQLTAVRAEAQTKVEAARATLEAERTAQLAEANAGIAERKAAAAAEVEAARHAAMADVESAVADVVERATELATGKAPRGDAVRSAVRRALGAGVAS